MRKSIQEFKEKPDERESEGKDSSQTLFVQKGIEILLESLTGLSGNGTLDW